MVEFGKIIDTIQHVRRIPQDAELEIEYVENEWCFGGSAKLPQEMMLLQFIKSRKMKVLN